MKTCILILGMHRSGTSALAGALSSIGLDFGNNFIQPSQHNIKGYYENKDFLKFNQKDLLPGLNSNWDSMGCFPNNWENKKIFDSYYKKAQTLILQISKNKKEFALKDPRISLLFPFWEKVLLSLNIKIKVVIIIRKVESVIHSLKIRNNFKFEKSIALWLKYNLYAEKHSQYYNRKIVSYEQLLAKPDELIGKIINSLNLKTCTIKGNESKLMNFIDSSLNHSTSHDVPKLPSWVLRSVKLVSLLPEFEFDKEQKESLDISLNNLSLYSRMFNDSDELYKKNLQLFKKLTLMNKTL